MRARKILFCFAIFLPGLLMQAQQSVNTFPGADEKTPSRAQYFSWINNTNEGATTRQTLINLGFFRWLKDTYGMQLDIYAFDAGAIDGKNFYGSMNSSRFKSQFPGGFGPIASHAGSFGVKLGLWGGPDGFGNTADEEKARIETMVSLCRDFNFELFKMDAVCGQLRPEKYDAFDKMMTECRKYSPGLILLNHRLNLGPGTKHSTTFLMGGAETYIDVHMANNFTASHHRAVALTRELPPKLTRLTEDHGVCLSSCLNYWEDDLILQAFNRNLILAPEIYGNPWLLNDNEFALLARIFNLHRQYRSIMVNGMTLSEDTYGLNAVSRGDDLTRLLTLRNLKWNPVSYSVKLDASIGLKKCSKVLVKTYHPTEKIIGIFPYGATVPVEVLPFRSCLVKVTDASKDLEFGIEGTDYQIIENLPGKPMVIQLLGMPGEEKSVRLRGSLNSYRSASLEGEQAISLLKGKALTVKFEGEKLKNNYHRKIASMEACPIPADVQAIYEATCFAADNNSLEARELKRSGETGIPQVKAARDAFFLQETFIKRETWDKYLFDNNLSTAFSIGLRWSNFQLGRNAFRLDLGQALKLDSIVLFSPDESALQPLKSDEGEYIQVSADLKSWSSVPFLVGTRMVINLKDAGIIRYIRLNQSVLRLSEVLGYQNGKLLDRLSWKASNLFSPYVERHWDPRLVFMARKTWKCAFTLSEIPEGGYLCIAVNGEHGTEGAYAGLKIGNQYVGCPDRAPSYRSNSWEVGVREVSGNYTYYVPLTKDMIGKELEAYVLGFDASHLDLKPEVYITAYPAPFLKKKLILE